MFKKLLRVMVAMSVLLAAYAGYVRAFHLLAGQFRRTTQATLISDDDLHIPSETQKQASELARISFGADHWTTRAGMRYYSTDRGYWMFAESYERKNDGKRIVFRPFALIWRSKDGKTLKTVSGKEAVADFDEPFDVIKPGSKSLHVVHARINDDVQMRDDKGTPDDRSDDLTIGLTWIEFDDPSLQIRSDSYVVVRDRDTTITGTGLQIDLRPHEGATRSGFTGAKTVRLLRNVHVFAKNAGKSGILPGKAKGGQANGPTPIDLQCAGEMKVVLPDPPPQAPPGQPAAAPPPKQPTLVWFYRNVRVRRGTEKPDQLDCDELFLTLMPTPKSTPASPAGAAAAAASTSPLPAAPAAPRAANASGNASDPVDQDGPLTELTLRRAEATGHAVWLQSEAQNAKIRGNQLIHEKLAPAEPDKTYIRGDQNSRLFIEKYEYFTTGPNQGKLKCIDTIRTVDVTMFDKGEGQSSLSTLVARGPGILETRAQRGAPVDRTATWQDQLTMRTEGEGERMRRVITLVGTPHLADVASGTLDATRWVMVWLRPKQGEAQTSTATDAGVTSSDTFHIERMDALGEVQMVQGPDEAHPNAARRTITAHNQLNVEFVPPPPPPKAQPPAQAQPAAEGTPTPPAPPTEAVAQAEPEKKQPEKPPEPAVAIVANHVWTRIKQGPGEAGKSKNEVDEARLRGAVSFHQDPAPEKTRGTDATGDAADLLSEGDGRYQFRIHGQPGQPAHVVTDEFEIEGPIIPVDQARDFAQVQGPGKLTMMVAKGMLNEQGLGSAPAAGGAEAGQEGAGAEKPKPPKVPMVITWTSKMEFRGRSLNLEGQPAAKVDFFGGVAARSEDAFLGSEHLEAYMDKTVSFTRPRRDPKDRTPAAPEPKPQIAFVHASSAHPAKAMVVNLKRDPETNLPVEKQWIVGHDITYNKLTGEFEVFEDGPVQDALVLLYKHKEPKPGDGVGEGEGQTTTPRPRLGGNRATVRPTAAGPGSEPRIGTATRTNRPPQAVGSRTQPLDARAKAKAKANARGSAAARKAQDADDAEKPDPPQWELTRIRFSRQMRGRFGSGNDSASSTREADFLGNVEVLHGPVIDENHDLDPDQPPLDSVFLTSHFLRVVSEPPPAGSKQPARNFLNALYNANAQNREADGAESAIQGDQITYDSAKKLFYCYALPGRLVQVVQRRGPGQPPSYGSGTSVCYNLGTGQSSLNGPTNFRLFDGNKVSTRVKDIPPPGDAKNPKLNRKEFRLPPRADKERRGFNGR